MDDSSLIKTPLGGVPFQKKPLDVTKHAVHVSHVCKSFHIGDTTLNVLKDVHFDTLIGELQMIVGPSGGGKTTLLSVIAGTLNFDQGEIVVFGKHLHSMSQKEITEFRRRYIGFIFQLYNLIPTLNILENISIPLLLNDINRDEAEDRAATMLKRVGLGGREKTRPTLLSGGEQQRVAIARALVHEPKLVICDEPTSALDAETGVKIMELIMEVARSPGRAVIVVTHDSRIFKYADRLARMDDGRVLEMHKNPREIL